MMVALNNSGSSNTSNAIVPSNNNNNNINNNNTKSSSCCSCCYCCFRSIKGCLSWVCSKKRGCFIILLLVTFMVSSMEQNHTTSLYEDLDKEMLKSRLRQQEPNKIERWRNITKTKCQKMSEKMKTRWDKWAQKQRRKIEMDSLQRIERPDPSTVSDVLLPNTHQHEYQIYDRTCQNTFIDLGTNIGDTIGYFIDASMDVCTPIWKQNNPNIEYWLDNYPRPRINVTSLQFETIGQPMNMALSWLLWHMQEWDMKPEQTCVYGMEGNPYFTKRLQKLENFLWQMNPRFFQHLHIHTEHVITKNNGPTVLYLDEVSTAQNFWGSSILNSLTDAKQTASLHGGQPVVANVTGINLTTLLKRTLAVFNNDAPDHLKSNGRLVIKMDVEGAEYQVLKEARNSQVLCDYIAAGENNQVIMLVEFHDEAVIENITEYKLQKAGTKQTKKDLEDCGVIFETMGGNWDH